MQDWKSSLKSLTSLIIIGKPSSAPQESFAMDLCKQGNKKNTGMFLNFYLLVGVGIAIKDACLATAKQCKNKFRTLTCRT